MLYTLEGIDGAGCGVVRRELEKLLKEKNIPFESIKYPVPNIAFGDEIYGFLDGKVKMTPDALFLAYLGQMTLEQEKIIQARKKVLIIDRYLPCTLVFQEAKGFSSDKGLKIAEILELEKPDKIFYLKLPWEIAYKRKQDEKRESDANEKNAELFKTTSEIYNRIAERQILAPWVIVDATLTPQEEAQAILKLILKDIND